MDLLSRIPVRARRGLALVGISLAAHAVVLGVLASVVVLPALYDAPVLESARLQPLSTPSIRDYDQSDADALLDLGLDEVDLARLREAPLPMDLTAVALPIPTRSAALPMATGPIDGATLLEHSDRALAALANPAIGRRGAFEGTVYSFRRIREVRTDGEWFRGAGKLESEDRVYAYRCLFPGRSPGDDADRRTLALDYVASVRWPESLIGLYNFRLASHESAVFQIDGEDVVVHDGSKSFKPQEGRKLITPGTHTLRLAFVQSPSAQLGVILQYRRFDGAGWEVFDLRDLLSEGAERAAISLPADPTTSRAQK